MSHMSPEPPSRSLHGKVAIVTGAGCAGDGIGNGRAISIMLADEGCNVVCVDRDLSWATKTADMANGKPNRGRCVPAQGDVTSKSDCESAVNLALAEFGRLDILVNNVGAAGAPGTAVDVDMEHWASSLELNVSSMVLMAKFSVPAMMRNEGEQKGVIINMGSVAGLKGGTPHLLYPTSKGAVVNMTRAMAAHHAKDGIRANCVCPGMLYTPMMYAGGMSEQARETRKARSLLGTEGTGWDAAAAVVFLASPHARWITGVVLPVDAGTTAAVGIGMDKSASVNA
ncbi:2-(S)-hydroxypropyl-CoM dehydrogenase [Plectosphaerella plurivora]|uniref:2-(S)-hydroxypropyl-CoM dehydrogenase n=1 Tax=Plectosphaerella plurivora TaxID=936078 RepID=A0A9P9AEW8_9PEZI|nr:2-(S)-hydroxypropyl-CoM dehydrogenase [Plectosphaerella plurivora]